MIPFDWISLVHKGPRSQGLRGLKLLRLLRLTRLLRMYRTSRLLMRYRTANTMSIGLSNILCVIVGFILAAHWLACVWGYVGNNSGRMENTWMGPYLKGGDMHHDRRRRGGWSIKDPKFQYLMSLYFTLMTLTTVGYGDILPMNVAERSVVTVMILFGGMFWSMIIAAITQTVATLDADHIVYNQRYDQINRMLVDLQVCESLRRDAREFLLGSGDVQRRAHYSTLINQLSPGLQATVAENVFAVILDVVPFFRGLDSVVKLEIFKSIKHLLFAPQEVINVKHSLMVITNHGFVGIGGRLRMIGDPLFLDFLVSGDEAPRSAVVLKFCAVASVNRDCILKVCDLHPAGTKDLLYARVYYALLKLGRDLALVRKKVDDQAYEVERVNDVLSFRQHSSHRRVAVSRLFRDTVDTAKATTRNPDRSKLCLALSDAIITGQRPDLTRLHRVPHSEHDARSTEPTTRLRNVARTDNEARLLEALEDAEAHVAKGAPKSLATDKWKVRLLRITSQVECLQRELDGANRRTSRPSEVTRARPGTHQEDAYLSADEDVAAPRDAASLLPRHAADANSEVPPSPY